MIEVLVMSVLPIAMAMRPESRNDECQRMELDMLEFRLDDDFQEAATTSDPMNTSIEITLAQSESFMEDERRQLD